MPAKQPENIAQPILDVVAAEERKPPPKPSDKARGDAFVAAVLEAKRTGFRRAMARGRQLNPPNPKPAA